MKTSRRILALLLMAGSWLVISPASVAGPGGGRSDFLESSRRQDFTGKGTYHRLGLFREQDRAIRAAVEKKPQTSKTDGWSWLRNLFGRKPKN